jgi:poly [ADP-ribose] polymerase
MAEAGSAQDAAPGEIVREVVERKAAIDYKVPDEHKYCVYVEGFEVFECTLNQVSSEENFNKFYIIQLLQENLSKNFFLWTRWGRVGYAGQHSMTSYGADLDYAKKLQMKKFVEKTGNLWSGRHNFTRMADKYTIMSKSFVTEEREEVIASEKPKIRSVLPEDIMEFVKRIADIEQMESVVIELNYDSAKCPLGLLTVENILEGYLALQSTEELINFSKFETKAHQNNLETWFSIPSVVFNC